MGNVLHLFRAPKRRLPMEELTEATAVQEFGFQGCAHARRRGGRQLLLIDSETLDAMDLAPGILRENITTSGLNVSGLVRGQRIRVGCARIEVSAACTPCDQMEKVRPGLRKELWGRRGMLCRVIQGGTIGRGDRIYLEAAGRTGRGRQWGQHKDQTQDSVPDQPIRRTLAVWLRLPERLRKR